MAEIPQPSAINCEICNNFFEAYLEPKNGPPTQIVRIPTCSAPLWKIRETRNQCIVPDEFKPIRRTSKH